MCAPRRENPIRKMIAIRFVFTGFLWMAAVLTSSAEINQNQFLDVTGGSGITYFGQSYAVAWGDSNHDGWPDLHHEPLDTSKFISQSWKWNF